MDNFKAFQLTTDQAMNVTGQGSGKGKGGKKGHLHKFINGLSEEDQTTVKTAITGLREGAGWADLDKKDRHAAISAIIEPYKG